MYGDLVQLCLVGLGVFDGFFVGLAEFPSESVSAMVGRGSVGRGSRVGGGTVVAMRGSKVGVAGTINWVDVGDGTDGTGVLVGCVGSLSGVLSVLIGVRK